MFKSKIRMLDKHLEKLISNTTNPRVFFPFCGKTIDMNWLASKGYEIVGVEFTEDAVLQFFAEQNIKYDVKEINDFKLYTVSF
jgi:thiopurine S-methyltransferase